MTKEKMVDVASDEFGRLRKIEQIHEELWACYYDLDRCTDPDEEFSLRLDIQFLNECLHALTPSAS